MKQSIFEFESYKDFLRHRVGPRTRRTGLKAAIAQALKCQPAYVSQVLHGAADFSLEQADQLNAFLGHTEDESECLLLMVQKERSGTSSLKRYFDAKLSDLRKKRMSVTARLGSAKSLKPEEQARYYSSWHYAAIHVALSVPALRMPQALSEYFKVPLSKVVSVIDFLQKIGLASAAQGGQYEVGPATIRLGNDSPHIIRHHANWRGQAVDSLDRESLHDLHYSGIVTVSKKDAQKLKDRMLERLKEDLEIVRSSPEEQLYCLGIDFFTLGR